MAPKLKKARVVTKKELPPPPSDSKSIMGAMTTRTSGEDYPERRGQPVCQYYIKTGMCEFGVSCKYHHPSQGGGSSMPTALNIYGHPLRSGEKECSYYVKTGQCKFGVTCEFNHPQPASVQVAAPVPGPGPGPGPMAGPAAGIYPTMQPNQQYGVPFGNWPVARPTMLPGSYVPSTYGPMLLPQEMAYVPGWNHPQPAGVQVAAPVPGAGPMAGPAAGIYPTMQPNQQYGVPSGNWPVARPTMLPGSYVPSTYGPMMLPQEMASVLGWNHPQPAGVQIAAPVPGPGPMAGPAAGIYSTMHPNQQYGAPSGNWPVARPTMLPGSYVPSTYGPMLLPQEMVSVPSWNHPQPAGVQVAAPVPGPALVSPAASASTQPNVGASPVYGVTQLSPQAPAYTGQYVPVSSFPAPSGSSPMSDISADLPQEVISDILLHLPAKSIGRFRCASKPWLSLLTSYQFIKAHLAHHTHSLAQQQRLLIISICSSSSRPRSLFSLTLHLGGNHLKELGFFKGSALTLLGSCNGLVLVDTEVRDKYVINCLTEEFVKLPHSPLALCPHPCFRKYGFGYDSLNDDYKIVSISQCDNDNMTLGSELSCADNLVDIYSLKMRSWKRFGTSPYGHDIQCDFYYYSCLFVNGAIHWLAWNSSAKESLVIVAFDLSSEEFKEIPAPASIDKATLIVFGKLKVIDGCLGIVVEGYGDDITEIWIMKSYLLVESWTKLVVHLKPLCFHQDKILFQDCKRDRDYKWYCPKDGRMEVCLAHDDTHNFREGITYSETLVSPHFNYHN